MKLQIGCLGEEIPGFKRLDIRQLGNVDYVQNAADLSNFEDGSIEEIYASHILEHFPDKDTLNVLSEWNRVIKKDGIAHISVPDFDKLVDIYIKGGRVFGPFFQAWCHGGQKYENDFHLRSFTYPVLSGMLSKVGFRRIERIGRFPYNLNDASNLVDTMFGIPISINVKAIK